MWIFSAVASMRCVCVVLPSVCQCVGVCVCVLVAFQLCTDMLAFQRWAHLCLRFTDQSYARMNLIRLQTTTEQAHLGPHPTNAIANAIANANLLIDSRQLASSEVQLKTASIWKTYSFTKKHTTGNHSTVLICRRGKAYANMRVHSLKLPKCLCFIGHNSLTVIN